MPTLEELAALPADRPRDALHYGQLLRTWRRLREKWPDGSEQAGRDALLCAISLTVLYKGQTDYPDVGDIDALLSTLTECLGIDPDDDARWADILARLTQVHGIRLARASALLHCLHPDEFPIVDRNAARALCKWAGMKGWGWPEGPPEPPPDLRPEDMTEDASAYLEYRRVLKALVRASDGRLALREVELALYNAGREDEEVTGI